MQKKIKVKANIDVIMTVWIDEDEKIADVGDIENIRDINSWEEY